MASVTLNPFTGTLTMSVTPTVKSIPLEVFTIDDDEFVPAIYDIEYNQAVYKFSQGAGHTLRGRIKVPYDYVIGYLRISFACYSPSIVDDFQFDLRSFLYLPNSGVVGSETLYEDFDSGVITNAAVSETLRNLYINVSDTNSEIGSTPIVAGAIIDFRLQRHTLVSGDDSADIRIIPKFEVIKA